MDEKELNSLGKKSQSTINKFLHRIFSSQGHTFNRTLVEKKVEDLKSQYTDGTIRWLQEGMNEGSSTYTEVLKIGAKIEILEELLTGEYN